MNLQMKPADPPLLPGRKISTNGNQSQRSISAGSRNNKGAWEGNGNHRNQNAPHSGLTDTKVQLEVINNKHENGGGKEPFIKTGKVSPMTPGDERPPTANSQTRKSAWERAQEKYQEQERLEKRSAGNKVHDDDDVTVISQRCLDRNSIEEIFQSKKFKDVNLESLYQRYFFKLNQYNLSILMGLLTAICVILIVFHYLGGSQSLQKGIILGIIFVTFILLELLCNKNSFNHIQLVIVCYIVLVLLVTMTILVTLDAEPRTASEGVWCTVFFIYMVYIALPIRMRLCVLGGVSLSVIQVACSISKNHTDWFLWKQVSCGASL